MVDLAVIAVVGVLSVFALVVLHRRRSGAGLVRRQFARHPTATIGGATIGVTVRLDGRIAPVGEPPLSEVSARPWVVRDLRIVVRVDDGAPTRPAQEAVDFVIDDGTGAALVRGKDVLVAVERDFEAPETTLAEQPWADRLLRAGGYHNGSPTTCRLQIYEGVIAPGDLVSVIGRVEPAGPEVRRLGATVVLGPVQRTPVVLRRQT